MTVLATASGCSGNRAWLAPELAPLVFRVEWVIFGEDLQNRRGAGSPVVAERVSGGDDLALSVHELFLPSW